MLAVCLSDRNPALADDPELDYDDAAELLLLRNCRQYAGVWERYYKIIVLSLRSK